MDQTQVFFSGYGRWGEWVYNADTDLVEWQYITKNIHNIGLFSLTTLDSYRYKYTKTLEELNVQRLEASEDEEDCAFLNLQRSNHIRNKFYLREMLIFEVDTSRQSTLESVRKNEEKSEKKIKRPDIVIDIAQINNKSSLNIKEVAVLTNLTQNYIYKLTSTQKMPHSKPNGKKLYFDRVEIENWMRKNRINTIDSITDCANEHIKNSKI